MASKPLDAQNSQAAKQALAETELKKPLDASRMGMDNAALGSLVGFLNRPDITGAELPKDIQEENAKILASPSAPVAQKSAATPQAPTKPLSNRLFITGKLAVGKDFLVSAAGYQTISFAQPLYDLVSLLFGVKVSANSNKDLPGMRELLQLLGQWGRGTVNAQYPYTAVRGIFNTMTHSMTAQLPAGVAWDSFGANENIWIDSLLKRVEGREAEKIAATNVRFQNEFEILKAAGWSHFHCLCSPATWAIRLQKKNLTPASPQVNDISEKLAIFLDNDVIKKTSQQRQGPKLNVVWTDDVVPVPSSRFYTFAEFLARANVQSEKIYTGDE